jgi:hypothetical protein
MAKISGGCSCGTVRFSANADPTFVAVCHCHACQKASGSAFAMIVAFPASALTVSGDVTTYASIGESGKGKHYRFCPRCGSPVSSNVDIFPDMMMIRAGALDDPSWVRPTMEIQCNSKQPWVELGGGLQSFAKMPG